MTPRKAAAPKGKQWACECGAQGIEENAEAAAQAWMRHWGQAHQEPGF
jgi:hypothetical protein